MLADTNLSAGRLRVSGGQGRGRHAALLSAVLHLALAGVGLGIWETRASAPAAPLMVVELVAPDTPAPVVPPAPALVVPETRPAVPQATTPVVPAKAPRSPARPGPLPNPVVAPVQAVAEAAPPLPPPSPQAAVAEGIPAPVLTASPVAAAVDEEMAHYALAVRLALGRAARDHAGPKGRVEISFGLDGQGGVRTGSIARSSGKPELDASALALVRETAFPLPPANSTDAQRTYVIPIEFR